MSNHKPRKIEEQFQLLRSRKQGKTWISVQNLVTKDRYE